MNFIDTPFGRIIADVSVPKDTILLIPPVIFTRYGNKSTGEVGEVKEYLEFYPKAAGIITGIGPTETT